MRLISDLKNIKPKHTIIIGDGPFDRRVLNKISQKYNGHELCLFLPTETHLRKTGLAALNILKFYPEKFRINSFIFIVDRDTFQGNPVELKVKGYLTSIGIEIIDLNQISYGSYLIKCKFNPYIIFLFCIVSGPTTFIEEDIAQLINLTLHMPMNLSGTRDTAWKVRIKSEVRQILKESNTTIEKLIEQAGKETIERSFPNICVVLKKIEENFQI